MFFGFMTKLFSLVEPWCHIQLPWDCPWSPVNGFGGNFPAYSIIFREKVWHHPNNEVFTVLRKSTLKWPLPIHLEISSKTIRIPQHYEATSHLESTSNGRGSRPMLPTISNTRAGTSSWTAKKCLQSRAFLPLTFWYTRTDEKFSLTFSLTASQWISLYFPLQRKHVRRHTELTRNSKFEFSIFYW